jgi:hypothetical protein
MRRPLSHLAVGWACSAALLAVGVPVGAWARGLPGALGVAAGVLLVALSYSASSLVVSWIDRHARHLLLGVVLLTYSLKCVILGLVLQRLDSVGWPGLFPLGVAVIVAIVGWIGTQLAWAWRQPLPTRSQT